MEFDIEQAIPHRPPFLFIDRVLEMDENRIVAEKWLDPSLDFFRGHYPGFPIMPGALTCESIFQAGAILLSGRLEKGVPVVTRIKDAKFKRMIMPGDTITLETRIDDRLGAAFYMKGAARVGGKLAVSVSFTCTAAPLPEE